VTGPAARKVVSLTARTPAPRQQQRGGVWLGSGHEPRLLAGLEAAVEFERGAVVPVRRTSFAVA
jgi:hypothetical protein